MTTELVTTVDDVFTATNFQEFSTESTTWLQELSTESTTWLKEASSETTAWLKEASSETTTWLNESEITSTASALGGDSTTENVNITSLVDIQQLPSESQVTSSVFEAFIIIEIVMTALELTISILAASKVERWRRNYRNQMLMQLSLVRFIKRIFALIEFLKDKNVITDTSVVPVSTLLTSSQIYLDFVIVILVFFFIRHMYDSLILVLVRISQNSLIKVLSCSWLLPLPISAIGTVLIATDVLSVWTVYLTICCIFKWPLMFLGTLLYISTLYRVLKDKIRKFARSLTVITFLLCLVINFYLFSKDIIWLFCIHSFTTVLVNYVLGFFLNVLILCLYIILLTLNFQRKSIPSNG